MVSWSSIILSFVLIIFSASEPPFSSAKPQIRAGIYHITTDSNLSDINSALFTHLMCSSVPILNTSTYQLSISPELEGHFSSFSRVVRQNNPAITTLLIIGGWNSSFSSAFSSMAGNISFRASFIESSIKLARLFGFDGLDLLWGYRPDTDAETASLASLLAEWRLAIEDEARVSNSSRLILTMHAQHTPYVSNRNAFPIESLRKNVDWVLLFSSLLDIYTPIKSSYTSAPAALHNHDRVNDTSAELGLDNWIDLGLPTNKLVLGLPYYGYAWRLVNSRDNGIGAPADGPAVGSDIPWLYVPPSGWVTYRDVKNFIQSKNGAGRTTSSVYNGTYVMNYVAIGTIWIGYDDVEAIRAKVAFSISKELLGYYADQIDYDDNWILSRAADDEARGINGDQTNKQQRRAILIFLLPTIAIILLLFGSVLWYVKWRTRKSKERDRRSGAISSSDVAFMDSQGAPDLKVFSFADIKAATKSFSLENKLGQGGYGPVYKGKLRNGQEIAVKRLSKSSLQGFEEFNNEVKLTARLQHVNLVRVLGFCTEREEKMLIYEYMPNKSLDHYLYDAGRRLLLDWGMRVQIVEGIIQGLLYLQEYSRMTVIHRDLKASNILLDNKMSTKISDFGMARIFKKNEFEANTKQIVGTYGYVPPEYLKHGIYSTKSDVYSFGVLLLQIISGKPNSCLYGPDENLNLMEYAYELWRDGKGREFMDSTVDDTSSPCKGTRFLQIALLCVQENPVDRPSILEISSMLRNETIVINTPKTPAFSIKRDEINSKELRSNPEVCSINNVTITEMIAR